MKDWIAAFGLNMAGAIGLRVVSKILEARGDVASDIEASGTALLYHLTALVLLIGALIFFIRAGMAAFRGIFR